MTILVADCPRCGSSNSTFDLKENHIYDTSFANLPLREAFCVCKHCNKSTIFYLHDTDIAKTGVINMMGIYNLPLSANNYVVIEGYVSQKDMNKTPPPKHLPENINRVFNEAAACLSINCYNASCAMFRTCLDLATKELIPQKGTVHYNEKKSKKMLGGRIEWLIDIEILDKGLKDLAECITYDGNDGAHDFTLGKDEAEDLLDFTTQVLEQLYTTPQKLKIAKERREERRANKS